MFFREDNPLPPVVDSPTAIPPHTPPEPLEMEGLETEEEMKAKKDRLREEQRQKRKAVS